MKKDISFQIKLNREEKTKPLRDRLAACLPGLVFLAGLYMAFFSMGQMKSPWGMFAVMLALSGIFMAAILWVDLTDMAAACGSGAVMGMFLLLSALFYKALLAGAAAYMNGVFDWLYLKDGIYRQPFAGAGSLWPFALWISVFAGLIAGILLRIRKWPVYGVLFVIGLFLAGSRMLDPVPAVFLLLGTTLSMAETGLDIKKSMVPAGIVSLVLLALLCGGSRLFSENAVHSSGLYETIGRMVHHLRYEPETMALPEGRVSGLGAFKPSEKTSLTVTMDHWQTLYLKGFTGGKYTGSAWSALSPQDTEKEKNLLYTLQKSYFNADTQMGAVYDLLPDFDPKDSLQNITIENTGACRDYIYVPYGMTDSGSLSFSAESLISEGVGKKEKQAETDGITLTVRDIKNAYLLQKELASAAETEEISAYEKAEASYRTFVYEHYLEVPDEIDDLLEENELLPTGDQALSTTDAKYWTTNVLSKNLTYDENTATPETSDFIKNILRANENGYCVHYASVAVMMLREMGIPARYVEGYLIRGAQAESLGDKDSLVLTQCNAHAWVEYYLDGVGWLPYDPTPGYTEEIEYELPPSDEADPDSEGYATLKLGEQLNDVKDQLAVKNEESKAGKDQHTAGDIGKILLPIAVALLILLLLGAVIRTILLRRRLKKHLELGDASEPKAGSAIWLSYTREILVGAGMDDSLRLISGCRETIAEFCGNGEEADRMIALAEAVWFSGHEISKEQQAEAKACSQFAMKIWKEKCALPKRLAMKYGKCKIL